ncbi:helix-turn-helix domain-containing protein [Natronosalvus vescus]|uniref:helix-turn-helix domain-containing protein n=1 Tax=Natronosalvus vescus TaxID=2953881 RepID=UPI002091B836|nr:helix-turn-helix domain-containing protein [Natronosalvus vescus]
MRYLDVWLDQPDWMLHPMQLFIRQTDVVACEELLAWTILDERDLEYELFYVEADLERYRPALDAVDSVRSYTIAPIDDGAFHLYVCQETRSEDASWRAAFSERNLVVVPPVRFDDRARMGLTIVGEGVDLQQLLEDMPPEIGVHVEEVGRFDRRGGALAHSLTDRQLEVALAAFECGYYDVPRRASLADVAEELEVAESSASVTLRRAERALLERVFRRYSGPERR